ncbi:hypothetical protein BKA70DRAFT_1314007, partial [Coprinopsis sp. MPI-PUGE-AT-0042]
MTAKRIRSRVYTALQHDMYYKSTLRKHSAAEFVAGVIFVNAVETLVSTKNLANKLHDSLSLEPDGKPRTRVLRNSWSESLNQPPLPLCATPGRIHQRVLLQRQCVPLYKLCDSVYRSRHPAGSLPDSSSFARPYHRVKGAQGRWERASRHQRSKLPGILGWKR